MSAANKIESVKKSVQKRLARSVDVCNSGIWTSDVIKIRHGNKIYSCQKGKTISVADATNGDSAAPGVVDLTAGNSGESTTPPVATTEAPTTEAPTPKPPTFFRLDKVGTKGYTNPCTIIGGSGRSTLTVGSKTYICQDGQVVSGPDAVHQQSFREKSGDSSSSRPVASFAAIALASVLFALH